MLFIADSWKAKTAEYLIAILLPVLCGMNSGMSATNQVTASWATHPGRSLPQIQKLSEVHLIYHQDFPYFKSRHYQPTPECVLLREKTKRQKGKPHVLRCAEHINLLLPATQANSWSKEQAQQGYVNLHAKQLTAEYVNPAIHARIILIKPATVITEKPSHGTSGYPATVLFIRHAHNVRTYRFKNLQTGAFSTMNSTDNHPFYSVGKRAFISIDSVSDSDRLITETGQPVRLICSKKNTTHCGIPYKNGQLTTVYNMETYPKHTYFAGKENHILVHNCSMNPLTQVKKNIPDTEIQRTPNEEPGSKTVIHHAEKEKTTPDTVRIVLAEDTPDRESLQETWDRNSCSIAELKQWTYMEEESNDLFTTMNHSKILHLEDCYGNQAEAGDIFTGKVILDSEGKFTLVGSASPSPTSTIKSDLTVLYKLRTNSPLSLDSVLTPRSLGLSPSPTTGLQPRPLTPIPPRTPEN